jgi:putative membrane protein insertion efficiency factor
MPIGDGNEAKEGDSLKSVPPWACDPVAREAAHRSIAVKVALTALRIYKVYLSILFAGNCRFQPTCSMYMYGAIERFGALRGSWMGLKRLLRCHPLSRKFGYDPVPEKSEMIADSDETSPHARPSNVASREAHS